MELWLHRIGADFHCGLAGLARSGKAYAGAGPALPVVPFAAFVSGVRQYNVQGANVRSLKEQGLQCRRLQTL
jgi:hypothetical protein